MDAYGSKQWAAVKNHALSMRNPPQTDWWKGTKYIDTCLIKKMELLVNIYTAYR